jgi:hypothetical protein
MPKKSRINPPNIKTLLESLRKYRKTRTLVPSITTVGDLTNGGTMPRFGFVTCQIKGDRWTKNWTIPKILVKNIWCSRADT